jgi:hypothetical protein
MVFVTNVAWDGVTLLFCLGVLLYVNRLHRTFKGSLVDASYSYYLAALVVVACGFAIKVVLDAASITPIDYGISVRDSAIIIALFLAVLGLRRAAIFWNPESHTSTGKG